MGPALPPGHLRRPRAGAWGQDDLLHDQPGGEKYPGLWDIKTVDEPAGFTFEDAFADQDFNVVPDLPVSQNTYAFVAHGGGTRATFLTTYATVEALQQVLDMGVVEGATSAINQIDAFLAADAG
nr:SRPBCC domain-containing protein [Nocardioides alcanivorans]